MVVTEPEVKAKVAELYRTAFDRYERSLPDPTFRSPDDEASWRRTRASSRHLADHLDDAAALVAFLLPIIPWTPSDDEGPMDIGPLYASVYPAVQSFMVAARALGIGTALTTVIRIHTAALLEVLGAPDNYEVAALVPMGRPAGHFGVARRKPVEAVTHWEQFGNRRR